MASTQREEEAEYRRLLTALRESEKERESLEERTREAENRAREAENRAREAEENPDKAMMLRRIKKLRNEENENGKEIYYENQAVTAGEVVAAIQLVGIVFQMVIAPCQAGKTGCMLAIIEKLLQSHSNVDPDNIFVITGLSDTEWVTQTKNRLPFIGNNVIHRGRFSNSTGILKNIKNALIIIDECQIACKEDMSLDKLFEQTGLKDLAYLKENNINIIEFSATPNSTLNDIVLWETCSNTLVMEPGQGYKGHSVLIENHRIHQAEDLFIYNDPEAGLTYQYEHTRNKDIKPAIDAIKNVKNKIDMSFTHPRFHIIRTPTGSKADTVIGRFKAICGDEYAYKKCYAGEDQLQLMDEMAKIPEKHTFLFIKEKARCAVTFPRKDLVGILYERLPKTPKDDVIVQGLAGRACGYDVDDGIILFTNVESIERYVKMLNSGFKDREGFTFTGCKSKKKTHLHPTTYKNTDGEAIAECHSKSSYQRIIHNELFETFQEAKSFLKNEQIWRECMKLPNPPRIQDTAWEKHRDKCGGYAVTSKLVSINQMNKNERTFIGNTPGAGTCISSTGNGQPYIIIPVYETNETPPEKEKYQVRYIKYNE